MNKKPLSQHDFKNWLSSQNDLKEFINISRDIEDPNEKFIGVAVKSKVGEQKLLSKIETEEDPEILVNEFIEEGGTILSVDDKKVQVEVDSGVFYIPRFCVKILKD